MSARSGAEPLVTIGIPTYNRADGYIQEALASALAQTYPRVEVLVADNCSDVDTESAVRAVAGDRARFVRHERNLGAQGNFNSLIDMASGEYFLLLHDDDQIDPDFVSACVEAMGDRRPGLVRTGVRVIGADGELVYQRTNRAPGTDVRGLFDAWFDGQTSMYFCCSLFNTAALRRVGGFDTPMQLFNDVAAYARVVADSGSAEVREPKATFRQHADNAGKSARVRAWAQDADHVVQLLTDLVSASAAMPDVAFESRARGFMCRNCYYRAERLDDPQARREAMAAVHQALGCATTPLRYRLSRVRSKVRRLVRPRPA